MESVHQNVYGNPDFEWLDDPDLSRICRAFEEVRPCSVRFVGGCVRDSLLACEPRDFDLATTLLPDEAEAVLAAAGLKSIPTGIRHGTITGISGRRHVQITTLRRDVSTDGRHARVAFTGDWALDAGRRDFTINALYLSPDGSIHDPAGGGIADIENGTVRFIGDPVRRIREDYLRILRFFRFSARFSDTFDQEGIAACGMLGSGITGLSRERTGMEVQAILELPDAFRALDAMNRTGVLKHIWPAVADIDALGRLKSLDSGAGAPLGLAALFPEGHDGLEKGLALSSAANAVRTKALGQAGGIVRGMSGGSVYELVYRNGKDAFMNALYVAYARRYIDIEECRRLSALCTLWNVPVFPFRGRDVLSAGIPPGPRISEILAETEALWIERGFSGIREIFNTILAKSGGRPPPESR